MGDKDLFFGKPYVVDRWKEHFPNAHVEHVANAGHFIEEDAPEYIARAIRRILTATPG